MQLEQIIADLQNLIKKKPTLEEIGQSQGVSKQAISNKKAKGYDFPDYEVKQIKEYFINKYGVQQLTDNDEDCIIVDYVHINPSCGLGTAIIDEPDITPIKLGKKMIETVLRVSNVNNLKIFKASGDSMSDTIDDSNLLLVDMGRTDYTNGGVFLLQKNNDLFIIRLHLKLSGELEVISDNPKYENETFNPNTNVEIAIRGRIIKNLSKGL
jgi:phage repressor protein C with HTH and peptisase S24 domain